MKPIRPRSAALYLDVAAAFNRDRLPLSSGDGPDQEMLNRLLASPSYCARLTEQETEEMLMELYVARRRRTQ